MLYVQVFLYLQVLDFLTTLVGFRVGASEASPFIRMLMQVGPAMGVALSKLVACVLAGICVWLGRGRLIYVANYWYSGLVVWNLCVILACPRLG
jgi:hypothetical protein